MAQRIRQSMSAHLRLERLDRTLLTGVPVSVAVLFFAMLAMIACYQSDGEAVWLVRMVVAVTAVLILLLYGFFHIVGSWQRSDAYLYTDPLCPCGSRTAMQELLRRLEPQRDIDITILYADLNHFKYVNDTFGHEAGDRMLRMMADQLREQFPDSKIYRIGEDEFVVFPSDAQEQPCRVRMEEISARLAAQGYSISYGLAVRKEAVGLRGLVREADERMLEARHAYYAARRRSPRIGASAE